MSWEKYLLGDILKRKKTIVKIDPEREYKLVTIKLYHKGVILRNLAKGSSIKSTMSSVKSGDFILSGIDARNGAFGIVPKDLEGAVITNDFWCLEPDESKISRNFFLYITTTNFFDFICKQSSDGTTQRIRLQSNRFFNYKIYLPKVEEQKIILEKLNYLSKTNKNLNSELSHQLDLIKQMRQAFLREAMQGKLIKSTNTKETGQQLLAKIKVEKAKLIAEKKLKKEKVFPSITEEEIPFEIPEHWVWCRLGEIAEIKRGKSPKYSESGVLKMLNQKCVRWFSIDIKHTKAIDEVWYNSINGELKIKTNDLLVNSTGDGTIGRSALTDISCENFMFDSHILRVRSLVKIEQKLLCYIINSEYGQSLIESIKGATSTKQTELGVNNLSNFPIPLPPLHEQEQIVAKLRELMAFCDGLEQSIKESQGYNEMLLQQVLKEALQPKVETKGITLESRKIEQPLKTILAGHIINLNNTTDFGRVKFQKLLYLTEYCCKIDFDSNYVKKAAGPYDDELIKKIEVDFARLRFYNVVQDKTETKRVRYTALPGAKEMENLFLEHYPEESLKINNLLMKLRPLSWGECEVVATIYAVWNNRIIKNEPVTDDLLYNDFMAWDAQKIKYKDIFYKKLFWMKEENIIADGWGKYVDKPNIKIS